MTSQQQGHVFLMMVLCGVMLGVLYDLLGVLRSIRGLCALTDLLYGFLCAAGLTGTALYLRCEPFRLYVFAAAACGMALYGLSIGNILRKIRGNVRQRFQKTKEKYKSGQEMEGIWQ